MKYDYIRTEVHDGGTRLVVDLDKLPPEALQRVGIDFNPSGDPHIYLAKAACAAVIAMATDLAQNRDTPLSGRAAATAATHMEAGQMFLVKSIAHRFNGR